MVRSSWVWMLCSRSVRVSPAAFAPCADNIKSKAANPMRRAGRGFSPVLNAPPARTCGLNYGVAKSQHPVAASICTAATWLTQSYRDGLMRTLRPRLPSRRSRHPGAGVWRKKAQEIQGFQPGSTGEEPGMTVESCRFHLGSNCSCKEFEIVCHNWRRHGRAVPAGGVGPGWKTHAWEDRLTGTTARTARTSCRRGRRCACAGRAARSA